MDLWMLFGLSGILREKPLATMFVVFFGESCESCGQRVSQLETRGP